MKKQFSQEYIDYLQSEHWRKLRQAAFKHHGRACFYCKGSNQIHVHHLRYPKPLTAATVKDVIPLCERCHLATHDFMDSLDRDREHKNFLAEIVLKYKFKSVPQKPPKPVKPPKPLKPKKKRRTKREMQLRKILAKPSYCPPNVMKKWKTLIQEPVYRSFKDECMRSPSTT